MVVGAAVTLRENDVKVMDIFFFFLFVNHGLDISLLKLLLKDEKKKIFFEAAFILVDVGI